MPFITEEIFQALPHEGEALMIQAFPAFRPELSFPEEVGRMEKIMGAISAIRSRRSDMNVPPSKRPHLYIYTQDPQAFESGLESLRRLALVGEVTLIPEPPADLDNLVSVVADHAVCYLPMNELVDVEKERARLEKELEKNRGFLENQRRKLANENFVSRAPEHVVAAEREREQKLKVLIANLEDSLSKLG
jgi:valyl-tRNA synthetase